MTYPLRVIFTALIPFACGYFASYLLRAVNAVVAPELVAEFNIGPGELGFLTSAYLLAFALFQLPLGILLDRYGPRRVQTVLLIVAGLGCLGFSLAPNFPSLVLARAIIGLGFSAGLMASYKASTQFVPIERRALANTAIMAMGGVGIVAATEPTAWLMLAIGWRSVFLIFAGFVFAVAALIFMVVPDKDQQRGSDSFATQARQLLALLKLPLFWRVAPMLAIAAGSQIALQTLWVGPWFRDVLGFDRPDVARSLLWMAFAFMFGILTVGVVADRLQRLGVGVMQTMLGFMVMHMTAQLVITLQLASLALPAWLLLAAFGQVAVLAYPWFASHVGENLAGRSNASINFAMFTASFAMQYLIGIVLGLFSPLQDTYEPVGYAYATGLCLLLQVTATLWYLFAPIGRSR